jgi:hypothetical protein
MPSVGRVETGGKLGAGVDFAAVGGEEEQATAMAGAIIKTAAMTGPRTLIGKEKLRIVAFQWCRTHVLL